MRKKGVTLVELLIAMAIVTIIMASLYSVLSSTTKFLNIAENKSSLQDSSRLVLMNIEKDIRLSSYVTTSFTTSSNNISYIDKSGVSKQITVTDSLPPGIANPVTPLMYFESNAGGTNKTYIYVLVNYGTYKELRKYNTADMSQRNIVSKEIQDITVQNNTSSSPKIIYLTINTAYKGERKTYSTSVSLRNGG